MKKATLIIFFFSSVFSAFSQDLKLWYKQPAIKWTEALPIGNGRIGAMVFGGVAQDRIQFNEETLWTGEPRNYNKPNAYKYLDTIRNLLFAGKQKEAEALAEKEFLGLKSNDGKKQKWINEMLSFANKNNFSKEKFDDSKWGTMTMPSYEGWEAQGQEGLDGAVWLRNSFELPASLIGKELLLDLNKIRDFDKTFINGILVGTQDNAEGRKYLVPASILHAGKNCIAVLVLNFIDKGGIAGYKDTTKHISIYSHINETEKISLNGNWKYFIQNSEPPVTGTYQASYQPFGDLYLNFKNTDKFVHYKRELDIENAIAATSYTLNEIDFIREYFVSQPNHVMAIQLTASKKGQINFTATLSSPHKNFKINKIDNNTISLFVKVRNGVLHGKNYLQVKTKAGKINIVGNNIVIENADEAIIYLSAGTNFKNYKNVTANADSICNAAFKSIQTKTYTQIKAAHIKEYQKYFKSYSINFGKNENEALPTDIRLENFSFSNDPSFVALYQQYGRYLLIASSRHGTKPANLQGIWNDLLAPPWGSKYTTNINAEMNYWPAELLNLSPTHEPLFGMIKELSISGRETAKNYYNAQGWVLHHNTDIWRGTAPINAANHGIWVTGGAWLCQHLWEHYLFTQDKYFLKNTAYPLMKNAALFFNSFLIIDPVSGYLISTPSNSPEQGGLVAGPTMDHQIIRALFKNVIEASKILNVDATFRNTILDKYKRIAPNKIGKFGQLQEWMQDKDDTTNKHRHISHLWGMYPGSEINFEETPTLMKAAKQSLLYRGDAATGWSLGWKINCWARLKDGEHTFSMIKLLLTPTKGNGGSYPNLFDAHPPFQIDGNFGGAAGIGEMLVQSHANIIEILPALPKALPNGEVKGICARGGFEIDIKWSNGIMQNVKIKSKAGGILNIRYLQRELSILTKKNSTYNIDASFNKF